MIEAFDFPYYADQDLYLRIYNTAGHVFDFDDNTFKDIDDATTPYAVATEQPGVGGAGESNYSCDVELSDINATATRLPIRWAFYNNANPQTSDRRVSARMPDTVISGKLLVEATAVVSGLGSSAISQLTAIDVTVTQPVLDSGELIIIKGDDYAADDGRDISFTLTNANNSLDLGEEPPVLRVYDSAGTVVMEVEGTASPTTGLIGCTFDPTSTDTDIAAGEYYYDVKGYPSSRVATIFKGPCKVLAENSGVPYA